MRLPDLIVIAGAGVSAVCFGVNHVRVSRRRSRTPNAEAGRRSAPQSMFGLLIEGIGFATVLAWPGSTRLASRSWHWFAAMLALASTWLVFAALRALGPQWRIKAVVTDGHELVTWGAYRWLRHPIYASMLGYLIAFGIAFSGWMPLAAGTLIYLTGTELRVRAEDGLLARRFGGEFVTYKRRVRAYVPFVR